MKNIAPSIIRSGNKIYQLKLRRKRNICPKIIFKDSFNFLSQKLDALPKTLDLCVQPKLFFPHGFNRPENIGIYLETLPAIEYYFPEKIGTKKKKEEFETFYAANHNKPFNLASALKEYCGMICLLRHKYFYIFL